MNLLDANVIYHGLCQGGRLPHGARIVPDQIYAMKDGTLILHGFHAVVFCAKEIQPHARDGGIICPHVIHAPMDDGKPMTSDEQKTAIMAAQAVFKHLQMGHNVLTTCAMGFNRSGLVNALALVMGGANADAAIRLIKAKRAGALQNDYFVEFIRRVSKVRSAA